GEGTRPYVVRGDSCAVLLDLAENPGIGRCRAADHDRITSGLGDHGAGVFRRADIAVADHGNFYRILDGGDPIPAGLAAVALLASASVRSEEHTSELQSPDHL